MTNPDLLGLHANSARLRSTRHVQGVMAGTGATATKLVRDIVPDKQRRLRSRKAARFTDSRFGLPESPGRQPDHGRVRQAEGHPLAPRISALASSAASAFGEAKLGRGRLVRCRPISSASSAARETVHGIPLHRGGTATPSRPSRHSAGSEVADSQTARPRNPPPVLRGSRKRPCTRDYLSRIARRLWHSARS